jgi:uncharacterized membrane protein YhaH (DUF805 family)
MVGYPVLQLVPVVGPLIALVLFYPLVCVTSQRLHDFGRSGWLTAIPYCVRIPLGLALGVMSLEGWLDDLTDLQSRVLVYLLLATKAGSVAFLIWVGARRGDAAQNAYGPPPRPGLSAAGPSPA